MSETGKAVFLSYASQDAEPARRICEALRQAGVEVWFDQSELRGGDAWDQKIRRQIKECALFVPVISANTNARAEGYFRLEWKLAVDRSHLMADDAPFLFPVVIGEVSDATARVPDKFREVQWTRLKLEETPAELAGRVARLLEGDRGEEAGDGRQETGNRRHSADTRREKRGFEKWWWLIFPIMGMSVPIIGVLKRDSGRNSRADRNPSAVSSPEPSSQALDPKSHPPSPQPHSEARQLAERARAMSLDKYSSSAADYATAEGLLRRALELDPNDAEVWTVASLFHTSIRTRGFDHAPARREQARSAAERATKLAPDSVGALFALGRAQRDSDQAAAEVTFRRILALDPSHSAAMAQLAWIYELTDRLDEAEPLYERVLVLDPAWAPLTHYARYLMYFHYGRFAEAEEAVRQSVALEPAANSVTGAAMVAWTWRGDAEAAARALATAPAEMQDSPRMIWVGALVHLARRDPAETLRTLQRIEAGYIQDNWFAGPKGMFAGLAHRQAGRPEAARVAWEAALAMVDERMKTTPDNRHLRLARGQLLAWLGRSDEARREARTLEELGQVRQDTVWMNMPVMIHAALGDADAVIPVLERLLAWDRNKNNGWPLTPALLRTDVRFDLLRGDPRFQKLCGEPAAAALKDPGPAR